tara:strand:+ start:3087 stop:4430 length:1344 start_codon:yes stop_codon:yes gene_type:complete
MSTVYEILKELEATPSSNEKLAIMERYKNSSTLKRCFELAYSPTINFFIKKIPDGWQHNDRMNTQWEGVFSQLMSLANREFTGHQAKELLVSMLNQIDCNIAEIVTRIIRKDMKCGVGKTIINKVWKGLIVVPPRQGAASMNEKTLAKISKCKNLAIEKKSDGSYANSVISGSVNMMSRNGNPLEIEHLAIHLNLGMFDGFALEGELVYDLTKATRQEGNGRITQIVRNTADEETKDGVMYQVWDCIDLAYYGNKSKYPVSNEIRCAKLKEMYDKYLQRCMEEMVEPKIILIDRWERVTMEEAHVIFEDLVKEGYEGAILKDMDAGWVDNGKPSTCVKLKRKDPADLIVVGMEEGKGKATGMMGMVLLESSDGLIKVGCGSGFSDEQRIHYWNNDPTGSIFETKYDSVTQDKKTLQKSLFLPIFVCERFDKDVADSYQDILDKVVIK